MPASSFRAAAAILVLLTAALPVTSVGSADAPATGSGQYLTVARVEPAPDNLSNAELLSQDLTVWLYPENRSIAVEGTLRLRANFDLTKMTLYLYQTLDLLNITQNGVPLLYTRNVERLTIDLAYPLCANSTTNLSFYYNGTMWYTENGARQDCVGWEGAYVKGSTFWYLRHHASDWFDCRLKLCCPPNWTAVADGDLVAEEHSAEWANYTWVNDAPCLRPAFAAGNYSVASKTASGINFSVYTYPEHNGLASGYLEEAWPIMGAYEEWLGLYGRRSFKVVETAHQTSTGYACSGFVMLYPGAFTKGVVDHGLLAHEMGHEWFPFATGYQGWAYAWLWEAFPEYLACLSEGTTTNRLVKDYNAYVGVHGNPGLPSITNSTWDTPYSYETVYAKGAWVLRMLHGIVGTDFLPMLAEYVDTYRWGYGSVLGFMGVAAKYSRPSLDGFWEQWLNTTKDLDVSIAAARQYENGTTVRLELEPVNLLEATSPAGMFIEYNNGNSERWTKAWDGRAGLLVFEVPSSVKQVYLDPDSYLLDVDRNNQAAVPLWSGKMYELYPERPSVSDALVEGTCATITAFIHNDGLYDAFNVSVDFWIDGSPEAGTSVDVPAQSWAQASGRWWPLNGSHDVKVVVDHSDDFHEWDEKNNSQNITVAVAPPPPKLDVWLGDLAAGDILIEGDRYAFNVTVRNTGDTELGNISVDYSLDGRSLSRSSVRPLAAGSEARLSLEWTATRGYHNLSVRADPDNLIGELDEGNNMAICSFFVRWYEALVLNFTPAEPLTLEPVTFSVEGDAEEFQYQWDDGTVTQWTTARVVVHTYTRSDRYRLSVEGRAGGFIVGDALIWLNLSNRPPEVSAYFDPASPLSLSTVVFTARTLDLDGKVVSVDWQFGDGANGTGSRAEHSYARPGNYTVRCTAHDNRNGENTTSLLVTIGNRPPRIEWTSIAGALVGEKLTFSANLSDPDGNVTFCRWRFGDGSSADGQEVRHGYSKSGMYLVTVTACDELGAWGNLTGYVEVKASKTAEPALPAWIWLPVPIIIAVVAVAWLVWSRRRISKQRDDFFQPPPREGQNP